MRADHAGHLRGGEQVTQDLLTDRIDFIEMEGGSMSGPDRQHSGASAGFEHAIVWLDVGKMRRQPGQPSGVENADARFAPRCGPFGWQAGFEIVQEGKCLPTSMGQIARSDRSTTISSIWKLSRWDHTPVAEVEPVAPPLRIHTTRVSFWPPAISGIKLNRSSASWPTYAAGS
jgi:hypothetical protein